MKPKSKLLIVFVLLININAFSQKSIVLKPYFGLQYPICKAVDTHPKNFNITYFDEVFDFGLLVNIFPENKLNFITGICFRSIGWSYSIKIPDNLLRNPYRSPKKRHAESIGLIQFPILVNIKNYDFDLSKSETFTYFSNKSFRIKNSFGLGLLYVPDIYSIDNNVEIISPSFYGDTITYSNNFQQLRKFGLSLDFMVHFSVRNNSKNKDILEIAMYYSKGIFNILDIKVYYTTNGLSNTTKIVARGTSFGITITKPLYITFKKKRPATKTL